MPMLPPRLRRREARAGPAAAGGGATAPRRGVHRGCEVIGLPTGADGGRSGTLSLRCKRRMCGDLASAQAELRYEAECN